MTIELTEPISANDLRTIMNHQLPQPGGDHGLRYLVVLFAWNEERSAWIVKSLEVRQPRLGDVDKDRYRLLRLTLDEQPFDQWSPKWSPEDLQLGTPLFTQRYKPKAYKTMDALYRDMRWLAGDHARVVLYEHRDDEPPA